MRIRERTCVRLQVRIVVAYATPESAGAVSLVTAKVRCARLSATRLPHATNQLQRVAAVASCDLVLERVALFRCMLRRAHLIYCELQRAALDPLHVAPW